MTESGGEAVHGAGGDDSAFPTADPAKGEQSDPFDGPLYAAIAHAPLGAIIVGVISGVLSGVFVLMITLLVTGQGWTAVAVSGATCAALLWLVWVWIWRMSETGHRWIHLTVATVMGLVVVTVAVLVVMVIVSGASVSTGFPAVAAAGFIAAVFIMVTSIRQLRRGLDPETNEIRRTNLRALVGVDPPDWVREHRTRLERIEAQLDGLAAQRPVPNRASSLREWWSLRPSWRGPVASPDERRADGD